MLYKTGDIWSMAPGFVVIPTNTVTRKGDGTAVMGAGLALDAAKRHPELPKKLGDHILRWDCRPFVYQNIICIPTKYNWNQPSRLDLIASGCRELVLLADVFKALGNNDLILLPKLGCGLGGLNWERQVRPVMDALLESERFILVSQP